MSPAELAQVKAEPLGPGEVETGAKRQAVVVAVDEKRGRAELRLGAARGYINYDEVRWAHPPVKDLDAPTPRVNGIMDVFSPGDVVLVRPLKYSPRDQSWSLELVQEPVAQAALLALENHTGRVRVMIGGEDFAKSQYNRALQARRQPGSAFKPLIYAAALDHPTKVYTSSTQILDAPITYDDPVNPGEKWRPKNYSSRFYGPTTMRQALAHSRNVVTVKLLSELGLGYVVNYARRLGITSALAPNLSLALGTSGMSLLEITLAYGTFADQGILMDPVFVERVTDPRRGMKSISPPPNSGGFISPVTAYLVTHLLKGVIEEGTGRSMLVLKRPLAGKTGTTNDLRDAWFVGYSPQLICGVWVGQDDNQPLGKRETGARAAGPIWRQFMGEALKGQPAEDFPVPDGVVFVRVNRDTGVPIAAGGKRGVLRIFQGGPPAQSGPAPRRRHRATSPNHSCKANPLAHPHRRPRPPPSGSPPVSPSGQGAPSSDTSRLGHIRRPHKKRPPPQGSRFWFKPGYAR